MRQRLVAMLLCAWSLGCFADDRSDLLTQLGVAPTANQMLKTVADETRTAYERALHRYDELIAARPFDVLLQIERCRFMRDSAGNDEEGNFNEEIYQQGQECDSQIEANFGRHPEGQLYKLERMYGKEGFDKATELQNVAESFWTVGQRARLYVVLANTAHQQHKANAGEYAVTALDLDAAADVRLMAAQQWKAKGNRDRAVEVLTSPLDAHDPKDGWYLSQKLEMLADLNARSAVQELYAKLRELQNYDHLSVAKSLIKLGSHQEARSELESQGAHFRQADILWERFQLELEYGTAEQAQDAYQKLRDFGYKQDPIGLNRVALLLQKGSFQFRARDLLAVLTLIGAIVAFAIAALIPISFVHYRGLARQAAIDGKFGRTLWRDQEAKGWKLRDAWLVISAFLVASLLAVYAAGPVQTAGPSGEFTFELSTDQQARVSLVECFISLLFMCGWAAWGRRYANDHEGQRWSFGRSVAIAVAWAVVFRLPLLIIALSGREHTISPGVQVELWNILESVSAQYGVLTALWMLVLAAPAIEEFMFRGVLLSAASKHLRFGWANVFQALLFSAAHFDLRATPFLFFLGLLLGWIRRRSGALWAPMIAHGVFNLIGGWVLLH